MALGNATDIVAQAWHGDVHLRRDTETPPRPHDHVILLCGKEGRLSKGDIGLTREYWYGVPWCGRCRQLAEQLAPQLLPNPPTAPG
jgi:hypothetical protein